MFLMITVTNYNLHRCLRSWWNGDKRPYVKDKWILRRLGPRTYLFKLNGATLALLWELKAKYNGDVQISVVELIYEPNIPEEVKEEVKKCQNNKTFLSKETLEKLSEIQPNYSTRLIGDSSNNRQLRNLI